MGFGEIALVLNTKRTATIKCLTPCEVYSLERAAYETVLSLLPEEQRLGLSFWDLLHCIVDMEPPALPATVKGVSFAPPFTAFVSACLAKDQTARPSAEALLAHPWLTESEPHLVDISTWLKKTHEDDEDALVSPPEKA